MNFAAHSRSLRIGRCSVENQTYLLTSVTANRAPVFADFWVGCACARALTHPTLWTSSKLLAWVLMPDHFHLLVELGPASTLAGMMKSLKSLSALEVGRATGVKGVWQRGYHDHALRTSEGVRGAARYLVANPIRAGLVDSVANYPFWDAVWVGEGCRALDP